ncbi:MAG: ATP-binding cassette domain-containing protein [Christensenellaceae bacterium]
MMDYFAPKKVPRRSAAMIEDCLQKVNLEDRIRSRVSTLSGGMVRRVGIAQSLLGDARVIIMDEPTSGLDPQERARFKNMVARMKGQDKLALISTHIVEDVESLCDRLVMHEGQVLFNGTVGAGGRPRDWCTACQTGRSRRLGDTTRHR